jgi:hypothetical protein
LRFYLQAYEKIRTFALSMRTMEMARQAGKIIALAKQKILPGQAAKTKSYRRQEMTNLCLTKNFYI